MSAAAQSMPAVQRGFRGLVADYAELTKARITALIVMTAWCGFFLAARKSGLPVLSWTLFHALTGIGLIASGTAALNEVMEVDGDSRMNRTASRPLPAGRMSIEHAAIVAILMTVGGASYLALACNMATGILALGTSVSYLGLYTPLKKLTPWCTFVGAFPGAMPAVLGWTAIRAQLEWETLALFAIMFVWQFPHFHSIGWLYREDYERAAIRMLPVVDATGRSTTRQIVLYSLLLLPVSFLPTWLGMAGLAYGVGSALLGAALFWYGWRLHALRVAPAHATSKLYARQLLLATVIYLPLLFALLMWNAQSSATVTALLR